jgi:hypothetical protein
MSVLQDLITAGLRADDEGTRYVFTPAGGVYEPDEEEERASARYEAWVRHARTVSVPALQRLVGERMPMPAMESWRWVTARRFGDLIDVLTHDFDCRVEIRARDRNAFDTIPDGDGAFRASVTSDGGDYEGEALGRTPHEAVCRAFVAMWEPRADWEPPAAMSQQAEADQADLADAMGALLDRQPGAAVPVDSNVARVNGPQPRPAAG